MTYLYCAYSQRFFEKWCVDDNEFYPFKIGTAVDCDDRLDRMNFGWKLKGGKRGPKLALCDGWFYPAPPLFDACFGDRAVDKAAENLFGAWPLVDELKRKMRRWQTRHVPKHFPFASNGVGELRRISIRRWRDLSDNHGKLICCEQRSSDLATIARLALSDLAGEFGIAEAL